MPPIPIEELDIKIDDVNKNLWQYLLTRKRTQFITVAGTTIVWELLAIVVAVPWLIANGSNSANASPNVRAIVGIIGLPIILIIAWLNNLRRKFEAAFLEEFAQSNGFSFTKSGTVDETYGTIFRLPGKQALSDIVTGSYRGNGLRLFLFQLTIGSGRSQTVHNNTVIELDLHGKLPNILMVNKQSHHGQLNLAESFGTHNTISLEGDFDQYFTLYAPANTQIEALEVFSPDTMALMEDESRHYTVEFAANRIYIYADGFITTTEQLSGTFALAKKLVDKIAPVASRLTSDSSVVVPPVNLANNPLNLGRLVGGKRGLITTILAFVIVAAYIFFSSHS